jgi:hypothetical protein
MDNDGDDCGLPPLKNNRKRNNKEDKADQKDKI